MLRGVEGWAYLREFRARHHEHDDAQELTRRLHLRSRQFEGLVSSHSAVFLSSSPGFLFLLQQRNDVRAGICLAWSSLGIILLSQC